MRYTLAAGGLAVFLSLILLVTGLLEMFYYIPTPDQAALSIQTLTFLVPFGGLVRNLHYWSAQFLVVVTLVHLLRVILTGSYAPPRRLNYLLGMGLLMLAVLLDFTGYVLRWDEGIHWALVTGTNLVKTIPLVGNAFYTILVGGTQPGPATLIRFYAWHIFGLTLAAGILVVWHIFRVRRDGGIAVPPPAFRQDQIRISRFELIRREVLAMLLAGAGLLLLATYAPAPLAASITASSPIVETARAPGFSSGYSRCSSWAAPSSGGCSSRWLCFCSFLSSLISSRNRSGPNWDAGSPKEAASHRGWLFSSFWLYLY